MVSETSELLESISSSVNYINWIGNRCSRSSLSVLLLSTKFEYIENISKYLKEVHRERDYSWRLIIHRATNVSQILQNQFDNGPISIDYVVILLDTSKTMCLNWAREAIKHCHPDLQVRRILLVDASGLPAHSMGVNVKDVWSLAEEYNLHLLFANASSEKCKYLCVRIFIAMETSIGFKTGIPCLHI